MRNKEQDFIVSRLKNQTDSGEGANVPPPMRGGYRVPYVTGIRLLKQSTSAAGTTLTIGWDTPPDFSNIRCYNVYVYGLVANNQPVGPYSTPTSPCHIVLQPPTTTVIICKVQTVLNNGLSSPIDGGPSIATTVTAFS